MIEKSCAFTGHRPNHFHFKYDELHPDCIALKKALGKEINALIQEGVMTFYTGMALGVDMWAAELVLELKKQYPTLKLIAAIPCETQANRWSLAQRERYFDTLSLCDEEELISRKYTSTCMFDRNRYMVDHAQHLIAVFDGQDTGGTAYTIRYAKQCKRNVIIIPAASSSTVPGR